MQPPRTCQTFQHEKMIKITGRDGPDSRTRTTFCSSQICICKNRFTLGRADGVARIRQCQPCYLVLWVFQPMSPHLVTTDGCDLLIPHMSWLSYLSGYDWMDFKPTLYAPTLLKQVCHIVKTRQSAVEQHRNNIKKKGKQTLA